jgi:hypothetical protein
MATSKANVSVKVNANASYGFGTYAGTIATILGAVGTTIAAIKANDTATVMAGVGTISAAVTTLGGRFAQGVALVRALARSAKPVVDELAKPEE